MMAGVWASGQEAEGDGYWCSACFHPPIQSEASPGMVPLTLRAGLSISITKSRKSITEMPRSLLPWQLGTILQKELLGVWEQAAGTGKFRPH